VAYGLHGQTSTSLLIGRHCYGDPGAVVTCSLLKTAALCVAPILTPSLHFTLLRLAVDLPCSQDGE
jgi:hypothetical protein